MKPRSWTPFQKASDVICDNIFDGWKIPVQGFQKKELRALDELISSFFFNFESNMLPKFSGASACSQAPLMF